MKARQSREFRPACQALARRQHGVVARYQLVELGISPNTIKHATKSGFLFTVLRGVYCVGRPEISERGLWAACVLASGEGAVLAGRTAAIAWDFLNRPQSPVFVIRTSNEGRNEKALLKAHGHNACARLEVGRCRWLAEDHTTSFQGIPILRPEPLLLQLAGQLSEESFRYAFWEADRKQGLNDRRLERCLELSQGKKGGEAFRQSVDCRLPHIEEARSLLEVLVADLCRKEHISPPEINRAEAGHTIDFRWPDRWLAVESDGYEFHRGHGAFERDAERDNDVRAIGWTILRFTYWMLKYRPEYVKATILKALESAGRSGPWSGGQSGL